MKFFEFLKLYKITNKTNIFSSDSFLLYKKLIYFIVFLILFLVKINNINDNFHKNIKLYINYINKCKNLKRINFKKEQKKNEIPFLSICIPVFNMEKYIERAILSVLNQTFKDFEIIIINDNSNDKSEYIIKKMQLESDKIRVVNHEQNLGIYISRIDAAFNAKGKYLIFLDPDDLFLNPKLFQELYDFNINYNLDIIEFTVYYENEGKNTIIYPPHHRENHYHKFKKKIIFQPELSNILFLNPENNQYSDIICRCIWNKMIKKEIILKSINFIEVDLINKVNFNFAEDTIINIINFQFASNYSNIDLPGYMYNIREQSASHIKMENKKIITISNNIILYFKLFYKYINYFNKDKNYLYQDIKGIIFYLSILKGFNATYFIKESKPFFNDIIKDKNISNEFKIYIKNFSLNYFNIK